ncbi:hypothetical protein C8Q75DRAFT_731275 [Abortiporus biennis]|nr:hypothetical protein C8Q75DRAFT_731275 [Abortiporus biennis]
MFALKTIVTFLAFLAFTLVSARPIAPRRCRAPTSSAQSSQVASATIINTDVPVSGTSTPSAATLKASSTISATATASATETSKSSTVKSTATSDKTSSSDAAKPTSSSKPSSSGLPSGLFPVQDVLDFYSSSDEVSGDNHFDLDSDESIGATKILSALPREYVDFQGKKALRSHFAKGAYDLKTGDVPTGGLSFYATGPKNGGDILKSATEATFGYSVFFTDGFKFNLGGKMPGLFGGQTFDISTSCSGGRRDDACWSGRFMFRPNGQGELYTYLPPKFDVNQAFCDEDGSHCNDVFGASIGRGEFTWPTGEWFAISQRVKLNSFKNGQPVADGEIEMFANGESKKLVKNLILSNTEEGGFQGLQFQNFFGGHEEEWASPQSQDIYFADISVAVTQK